MHYSINEIESWESRFRANFINSLAGVKQVVLVGTKSKEGLSNLAIFNSLIHIGANPPMYGLLFRPTTVRRDTLTNILETQYYTFNYVEVSEYKKAHQTSAKYETEQSEFTEVGFKQEIKPDFFAPFIENASVQIGLKFEQKIDIALNNTILVIGSIQTIELKNDLAATQDGFVPLSTTLACQGLDAYLETNILDRLSYAKADKELNSLL